MVRKNLYLLILLFTAAGYLFPQSSRFTNPFTAGGSNHIFSVTDAFTLTAENSKVALYLNHDTLAIRILNKETGFIWSSDIEDFGEDFFNERWRAFISSGVTIEYFTERMISGRTVTDRSATEESFLESGYSRANITRLPLGFRADVVFGNSGIRIVYETVITENGIETSFNPLNITETGTEKIVSVRFYPFLGAARYGSQNGYFLLPDGDGSLVRFDKVYSSINTNYEKRYYGDDYGITPSGDDYEDFKEQLNYPVYGIVHGIHDNALMNEILEGAAFAQLLMYPAGVRTNYYFISNRYLLRQPYTYIVSTGAQTTMITPQMADFQIRERITLLSGKDADYTGIAKAYRESLLHRNMLNPRRTRQTEAPLFLSVLAGASNTGIFRNNSVLMTSISDASSIVSDLRSQGIGNVKLHFSNMWRKEFSARERDRYRLYPGIGSMQEMRSLDIKLRETGGTLLLDEQIYSVYDRTGRLNSWDSILRNINGRYSVDSYRHGAVVKNHYILNSRGITLNLRRDIETFIDLGFNALNYDLENPASSFNRDRNIWRTDAIKETAQALYEARRDIGYASLYRWNAVPEYFSSIDALVGLTMSAALFPYITDTVPFTSIVLRGRIDLFSYELNNVSNPEETLLRLIEWGIFPAYLVTHEDPNKLLYSDKFWIVSSRFSDWRSEIIKFYNAVNDALKPVLGADIQNHEVLAQGVMKTTYENGVCIYVNYNTQVFEGDGVRVNARSYEVRRQ